jgi:hypothetical protein
MAEESAMRITGKIAGANIDFRTRKPMLSLEVNELNDFKQLVDDMNGCEKLSIEIKPYREKRSLNANNYCWKILTEIGNVLRASKDEIYLMMLKRYGQSELISVLSHIPIEHYVKYYEEAGESKLNGKMFTHYRVYKGSSDFDTREMSIFIDGVVSEAKELGIQTETPDEIARLKSLWGSR